MGGIFGVASKNTCTLDLFFGVDYHSHLGTKRGGLAVYTEKGFERSIHNIENSPFRTKMEGDLPQMQGKLGIGCISDSEPQPLMVRSHLGNFAITTVGRINNLEELVSAAFEKASIQFLEMSNGRVNPTELVAALINQCDTIEDGIRHAQEVIDGSMTLLLLTDKGIYCARDLKGRTPLVIGKKEDAMCASFESFAYLNLGYSDHYELGPGEVVFMTADSVTTLKPALNEMKMCAFLWVYFGYPPSAYEGENVENVRYRCGQLMAKRDDAQADLVAGVPDSGIAHAVGYANASGIPFARPFIKYTPTWPRSFMPQDQSMRNLIAHMKLIPVNELIKDKSLLMIDDSIVRGTQLRETTEFLYRSGAKEVHIRPGCPPLLYGCKFLNFSRSTSDYDLITRRVIKKLEGDNDIAALPEYADPDSEKYAAMVEEVRKEMGFTSLKFNRLDDMIKAIGVPACKLCTYCWNGKG